MNKQAHDAWRRTVVGAGRHEPVEFAFWSVQPEIVVDNISRYAAETGERIACIEIPGDYEHALSAEFSAGRGPHAFYAQRAEASLWYAGSHIAPLVETDAAIVPLLARMDPRFVAGARQADGQLLGLTYYNGGPFCLFAHQAFAGHLDLDDVNTWQGLLEEMRRLKQDGICIHPFLPRWHMSQTGLVWSVLCHLATEGVFDFAMPGAPAALSAMVSFFRILVDEDLVPPATLADQNDSAALERWATGRHAIAFTMDYLAIDACERVGHPINVPAAHLPGRTGTPLMPGHAVLCARAGLDADMQRRATNLLAYLGGTARDGSLRVHARWLSERLFAVPYTELDQDAGILAAAALAFPSDMADACVLRLMSARRAAVVSPLTHAPWFLEWSVFCDRTIRDDLLSTKRASTGAKAETLLERWSELSTSGS
jgi:hypothetical protein